MNLSPALPSSYSEEICCCFFHVLYLEWRSCRVAGLAENGSRAVVDEQSRPLQSSLTAGSSGLAGPFDGATGVAKKGVQPLHHRQFDPLNPFELKSHNYRN